ncbi:MAG: type II toxin-antitoxin system VapC family toxin [Pseudorhodoplanes sp.]|uniref:type II toxin-antitoxin system VapC family toxin n=1 Tax=Pseudorhodoplanes sp. TaxID=1934341 RepID=UPI003D1160F4
MALLIDTCAMIFVAQGDSDAKRAIEIVQGAHQSGETLLISPISAWEIGLLNAKGRLKLSQPPGRWFDNVVAKGKLTLAALTPGVLVASSFLPECDLRDPADRIIAATAREFDYTVLTRDRLLLGYAGSGHMRAIGC